MPSNENTAEIFRLLREMAAEVAKINANLSALTAACNERKERLDCFEARLLAVEQAQQQLVGAKGVVAAVCGLVGAGIIELVSYCCRGGAQ